jgi:hypothetical protein
MEQRNKNVTIANNIGLHSQGTLSFAILQHYATLSFNELERNFVSSDTTSPSQK